MESGSDNEMHSIFLDISRCNGCINCLKRCPTQAIRVRDNKAYVIGQRCIDCGVCVSACSHKAKRTRSDSFSSIKDYRYKIALPPPSIYAQFNNLENQATLHEALLGIGFDEVYEVTKAVEIWRQLRNRYLEVNKDNLVYPVISTTCSVVTRLIKVRYPDLIDNLLPMITPIEVAGMLAKEKAIRETGLKAEEIGCVFLTPCPAKVSEAHSPIGTKNRYINLAVAINEIYPLLLRHIDSTKEKSINIDSKLQEKPNNDINAARIRQSTINVENYLSADGIENIITILEDLESHDYNLEYVDLSGCNAGCFGGVLQVENPFIAQVKNKRIHKIHNYDIDTNSLPDLERLLWDKELEYVPTMELGDNKQENFERLGQLQKIVKSLPGLDCGRCGAPSCESFAQDVVTLNADIRDCVVLFREQMEQIYKMMGESLDL